MKGIMEVRLYVCKINPDLSGLSRLLRLHRSGRGSYAVVPLNDDGSPSWAKWHDDEGEVYETSGEAVEGKKGFTSAGVAARIFHAESDLVQALFESLLIPVWYEKNSRSVSATEPNEIKEHESWLAYGIAEVRQALLSEPSLAERVAAALTKLEDRLV